MSNQCQNCYEEARLPYSYCTSCRGAGIGIEDDARAERVGFNNQLRTILAQWKSGTPAPEAMLAISQLVEGE